MDKDLEYKEHHIEGEDVKIDGFTIEVNADSPQDIAEAIQQIDDKLSETHGEKRSEK